MQIAREPNVLLPVRVMLSPCHRLTLYAINLYVV